LLSARRFRVTVTTAAEARWGSRLPRPEWAGYFNELTRRLEHGLELNVTLEVVGENVVGTEVERLPLCNVTYEPRHDNLAIGVGGRGERYPLVLWHYVERPRLIWVHEREGVPTAIAIESADAAEDDDVATDADGQSAGGTLTLMRTWSRDGT
jgi:hypothetical protein